MLHGKHSMIDHWSSEVTVLNLSRIVKLRKCTGHAAVTEPPGTLSIRLQLISRFASHRAPSKIRAPEDYFIALHVGGRGGGFLGVLGVVSRRPDSDSGIWGDVSTVGMTVE